VILISPPLAGAPTALFGPAELQIIPQKLLPAGKAELAMVWLNPEATIQQYIDVLVEHMI
jgi:hypothetical protein